MTESAPGTLAEEVLRRLARDLQCLSVDLELRPRATWLHPAAPIESTPRDHEICLRFDDERTGRYLVVDSEPLEPQLMRIADNMQDDLVARSRRAWPSCPGHIHAASVELLGGEAVWVCPLRRHVLARVGALPVDA